MWSDRFYVLLYVDTVQIDIIIFSRKVNYVMHMKHKKRVTSFVTQAVIDGSNFFLKTKNLCWFICLLICTIDMSDRITDTCSTEQNRRCTMFFGGRK